MKNPYFSIITCTYNSEKFVPRNIASVKKQIFNDYEHVFIDGKSTDKTGRIISDYKRNNSNAQLFSYEPKGVANAFAMGVKHAKGKYIIHLNSDDYFFDRNVLKDVSEFIKNNPNLDWIYGQVNVVDDKENSIGLFPRWKIFQSANKKLLKFIDFIPHQSVFIKKDVFKRFGNFDESVKYIADYEYWLRIADKTKWIYFDRIVANYTAHKDSVSLNRQHKVKLAEDTKKFHRKYTNYFENSIFMFINYSYLTDIYRRFRYYK